MLSSLFQLATMQADAEPSQGSLDLPCHMDTLCGTWQGEYTELHNGMMGGGKPMRRLVSVPTMSGFADRIVGSITAMLFALLSERAICFETQTANGGLGRNLRPLTDAFAMETINWENCRTSADVISFLHTKCLPNDKADTLESHSYGPIDGNSKEFYTAMVNGWGKEQLFTSVLNQSESYETVYLVLNRGMTVSIFKDPALKARVEALGLSLRHAFACLYKYLFLPNSEVHARFPAEFALLADPYALKIGIQIRTGDHAHLADSDAISREDIGLFQAFFDCAQQIEATRLKRGQRIIWYVISDSVSLRKAVYERFGGKVFTRTYSIDTSHTAKENRKQGTGHVSLSSYQDIAGEHWLFGMTDFQVVSYDSGIGRSAAFLGQHMMDTVYTIYKWYDADPPTFGQSRQCGIEDVDRIEDVAAEYSMI